MKENIDIEKFIKKINIEKIFKKLFPICRSITGKGFEESLDILSSVSKLNKVKIKTGTKVLGQFNINDSTDYAAAKALRAKNPGENAFIRTKAGNP